MSDTSDTKTDTQPDQPTTHPGGGTHQVQPGRQKRRSLRFMLISLGSLLGLLVAIGIGAYVYVNHAVSSIPRVHVGGLAPSSGSQTFLITGSANLSSADLSNLIMLLHINGNGTAGGAVTIPANVTVDVPGHGIEPLWTVFETGGPTLLVQTIERVTGIPINHYARIDFSEVSGLVNAIGGVNVTVPVASTSDGYRFFQGVNHLDGVTVIYYARDGKISDQDRLLRQEILVRAILSKIADDHLVTSPLAAVHVLNSLKSMLTVDSNLTNSDVVSLVSKFGKASASGAVYLTAATQMAQGRHILNPAIDDQLWTAVKQNSIAAFAKKYASTVTPAAVP
jgi:LCP family protein required for cell wall assembly